MMWVKTGLGYIISFLLVSVFSSALIVLGNDILKYYQYKHHVHCSILQLNYAQWLPVCSAIMAATFLFYLVLSKLFFSGLRKGWLILICGFVALGLSVLFEVSHLVYAWNDWYEIKNAFVILGCGGAVALFSELL